MELYNTNGVMTPFVNNQFGHNLKVNEDSNVIPMQDISHFIKPTQRNVTREKKDSDKVFSLLLPFFQTS